MHLDDQADALASQAREAAEALERAVAIFTDRHAIKAARGAAHRASSAWRALARFVDELPAGGIGGEQSRRLTALATQAQRNIDRANECLRLLRKIEPKKRERT